jgi:hypothetical protein
MQLDDAAGEALVSLALEIVHGLTALAYEGIQEGNTEDRKRGAMGLLHRRLVALVNVHRLVDGVPAGLPAARERLLRYCARPPLALERLSVLEDGNICYRIKDSEKVRLMTPTQFMARIAALVPPPRHPLVRFYGAWAPHHRWRSRVVTATPLMKRSTCSDPSAAPVRGDGGPVADDETPPAPQRAESRQRARRSARTPSPRPRQPRPCLEPSRRLSLRRTTRPRSYGS